MLPASGSAQRGTAVHMLHRMDIVLQVEEMTVKVPAVRVQVDKIVGTERAAAVAAA